jgi:hypothetical protein
MEKDPQIHELLDVLNEKGEFTGVSKPRGEIHELGLFHKAIHCWIINSYDKYFVIFIF